MNVSLVIDGIILLVVVEFTALALFQRRTRHGMPIDELLAFLGAGLGLLFALRVFIAGGPILLLFAALLASLVFHLWHVRQRWQ